MSISKELLSEVLNISDIGTFGFSDADNSYSISGTINGYMLINIHELAHKVKEWLKTQNCMLSVYHHLDTVAVTVHINGARVYSTNNMQIDTEPEAIFQAGQWILDNNDNR